MIIDVHQHVGAMPIVPGATAPSVEEDLAVRLAYLDQWRIDAALLMPSSGVSAPDGVSDRVYYNDLIADYRHMAPDRFRYAVGTVHPGDGERGLAEIDRCIGELGFSGMVWHHHFLGTAIDHPGMHAQLDRIEEHNAVAFVHVVAESALESPWRLEKIAEEHPGVTFVALDAFGSFNQAGWCREIAKRRSNIHWDIACATSVAHQLLDFIAEVGYDRLLLGTDFYGSMKLFGVPFALEEVRSHLGVQPAVADAILGGNARALLDKGSDTNEWPTLSARAQLLRSEL